VLDDEIKLTVKALIGKFASVDGHVSAWPNDFVKNKGQGRIFLLHGSPGVGKLLDIIAPLIKASLSSPLPRLTRLVSKRQNLHSRVRSRANAPATPFAHKRGPKHELSTSRTSPRILPSAGRAVRGDGAAGRS
jgi:hypothetical protein